MPNYFIFKDKEIINTIEADEEFCKQLMSDGIIDSYIVELDPDVAVISRNKLTDKIELTFIEPKQPDPVKESVITTIKNFLGL